MQQQQTAADMPLVSVVIPCFNAGRFIADTVGSVLTQSYSNLELIAADDCSTDDIVAIVEDLARADARVRWPRRESKAGAPAKPRNLAVAAARGEWVAFLD